MRWSYSLGVFRHAVSSADEDDWDRYEVVFVLKEGHLGYAFHPSTDPDVLQHLQGAVDTLRADGSIDSIISNYSD